jgi:osmoprotectant transport system substrate-binding protein
VALKPKITISSTTDPVSRMLAEIYGQSLEKAEFRVARKKAFETSDELFAAMTSGEVQLTGMTTQDLLALVSTEATTDDVPNTTALQAEAINKVLPDNLVMGSPTTAEDKAVVFCATTFTDANTIATLTDFGAKPGTATLAAPEGFEAATPLGGAGLKDTYEVEFKSIVPTTADKVVEAVNAGTADCGVGRSADPALSSATLKVLQDDKALVPNDVILPLMSTETGSVDVLAVLDNASARLTTETLRVLMSRLTIDGASPEIVALEFTGNAGT